ncbi:hypothetical protein Plim_4013 [Planctopirus limnophila DSM 3776]|uniref:Uncharacterized protein n=1 Tax=Planctopirus limnophila (strain ATCC 43296 / DSM 3776 / IFAM 1008 / Mu 290) TaxID=521674 RepID=D5SY31_PLAL2|nr:hypothetical protein [Planctopirus limnophila]ADG69824.1 hypothetical protein Plim_4013 [Planctopirus limnophila DSM 3776]
MGKAGEFAYVGGIEVIVKVAEKSRRFKLIFAFPGGVEKLGGTPGVAIHTKSSSEDGLLWWQLVRIPR